MNEEDRPKDQPTTTENPSESDSLVTFSDSEILDWVLETGVRPAESRTGLWIVQRYVGRTIGRGPTKRAALIGELYT